MMSRRNFVGLAAGAAVGWPLAAQAQQASKVSRIGYLGFSTAAGDADRVEALRAGLRALGYVEARILPLSFAGRRRSSSLQEAAAELVRVHVDVIFAPSSTERPNAPSRQPARSLSSSRRMPTPSGSDMSQACRGQAETLRD